MKKSEIGAKIRSIRLSKGITATFMARKLGYKAVSSYIRLETGESSISLEQAKKIADLLAIELKNFFDEDLRETHKIINDEQAATSA